MTPPRRWLLAPDSFKGTLTAAEVVQALGAGIRAVQPGADLIERPMADGGEGTLEALAEGSGGRWGTTEVGPAHSEGARQRARWLERGDGSWVVELADVAGLAAIPAGHRSPLITSTHPLGALLEVLLSRGARSLVIGLGGSATVDGGLGALQALGAVIHLEAGRLSRPCIGADLRHLQSIDLGPVRRKLKGVQVLLAVDVRNPLTGPQGAARIYGPQKGADEAAVQALEAGLQRLAGLLGDPGTAPGDGSAGGAGYGLRLGLGAQSTPGAKWVAEAIGLPEACGGADCLVTGEGCYDDQTDQGKVAWEVGGIARAAEVPAAIVAGSIRRTTPCPFDQRISLEDLSEEPCGSHAERVRAAGRHLAGLWSG